MDMSYQNRHSKIINSKELDNQTKTAGFAFLIIMFLWIIVGFAAFVSSIVCFGRSGTMVEKIIGLLLAIFFGPFYFLFYGFNQGYCR